MKDLNGKVFDYVNGIEDLKNRIIRFVGVADKRVKEDYLRILRYFRFYSRVCDDCNYHDEKSINAIRDNCEGLESILLLFEIFIHCLFYLFLTK